MNIKSDCLLIRLRNLLRYSYAKLFLIACQGGWVGVGVGGSLGLLVG